MAVAWPAPVLATGVFLPRLVDDFLDLDGPVDVDNLLHLQSDKMFRYLFILVLIHLVSPSKVDFGKSVPFPQHIDNLLKLHTRTGTNVSRYSVIDSK